MGDAAMIQLDAPTDAAYGFKLGDELEQNGNKFKYVKSAAAIDTAQAVIIDPVTFVATELTTALAVDMAQVGVTKFAFTAADQFGWVQTKGQFDLDCVTGLSAKQQLFTSTTPGRVGPTGGGAILITGAGIQAANSGNGVVPCYAVTDMYLNV